MREIILIMIGILIAGEIYAQDTLLVREEPNFERPDIELKTWMDSVGYSYGVGLVNGILKEGYRPNGLAFYQGIMDMLYGDTTRLSYSDAGRLINESYQEIQKRREEQKQAAYEALLASGEEFLAENKDKEGVVVMETGMQYKIEKQGEGRLPSDTSRVLLHYREKLIDGTIVKDTWKEGEPEEHDLDNMILGWIEALMKMKEGSKWTLYLPAFFAYGDQGKEGIAPGSVVIYDLELVEVLD